MGLTEKSTPFIFLSGNELLLALSAASILALCLLSTALVLAALLLLSTASILALCLLSAASILAYSLLSTALSTALSCSLLSVLSLLILTTT